MPTNSLFTSALLFSLFLLPLVGHAAIYKCTGADAKVTISDQPCSNNQSGGEMTVAPASGAGKSPPSAVSKASPSPATQAYDARVASQRTRLLAVLSPECQKLSKQLWEVEDRVERGTSSPTTKNPQNYTWNADYYYSKCAEPTKDFLENTTAAQRSATSKAKACDVMRLQIGDLQRKIKTLHPDDKVKLEQRERDYASAQCEK